MPDASKEAKARAEELGIDIEEVEGTGKDGNIKVSDVEAAVGDASGDSGDASSASSDAPRENVDVILNPSTNLASYTFGDGFEIYYGQEKTISADDWDKYKSETVNVAGRELKVLKKA